MVHRFQLALLKIYRSRFVISLMIVIQFVLFEKVNGQVDNINIAFTKYAADYSLSNVRPDWYWFSFSASTDFSKNNLEYGVKLNATYLLTEAPGNLYSPIPRDSRAINNLSLFIDYKRQLPFSSDKVNWSIYGGLWISNTQFFYTDVYYVDTAYYYENKFTERTNILNFNLGAELRANIKGPVWFFLKSGIQATFIGDSEIGSSDFRRFRAEFGLSYEF